jgi:hypothetical protein
MSTIRRSSWKRSPSAPPSSRRRPSRSDATFSTSTHSRIPSDKPQTYPSCTTTLVNLVFNDRAIRDTLGDVRVTAPKSFFGNLSAGAGAVEMAASVLAFDKGPDSPHAQLRASRPQLPGQRSPRQAPRAHTPHRAPPQPLPRRPSRRHGPWGRPLDRPFDCSKRPSTAASTLRSM